jgi:hypothetical protein
MGGPEDPAAVVDPHLRVYGLQVKKNIFLFLLTTAVTQQDFFITFLQ